MGASRSGGGMTSGQKGTIHKQAATLKGAKVKIAPRTSRSSAAKEKPRGE
jgi:hypothetical protein